jgi:hypothetical protein
MNPQDSATEITPDATMNLELFLDDSFLEREEVEKPSKRLEPHHSATGGTYLVVS